MEKINEIIDSIKQIPRETVINILIAIIIAGIFYLFSHLLAYGIIKIFNMKVKGKKIKQNSFYKSVQLGISLSGIYLASFFLKLPAETMNVITKIYKICIICLTAKGFAKMIKPNSRLIKKIKGSAKVSTSDEVINIIVRILRGIIYIIAGAIIISELGYNLNGIVTGLGLGGVVIALAAQDVAKSLFAGLAMLIDKPFSVGDWIETSSVEGEVEDVSFHSTKIRTKDNTLVSVPNNKLVNENIVNYTRMKKRRYLINLVLVLETSPQEIVDFIEKAKFVLNSNEHVLKDSVQVHFENITDDGYRIFIYLYTDITDYVKFLDFKEEINLTLLHTLESQKIELAYPTKTVYLKK